MYIKQWWFLTFFLFLFCRPEIVPEISLEELEEPLLSTSSTNDSAIAVESEVRKLEVFQKVVICLKSLG